jgi:hypothetical protein
MLEMLILVNSAIIFKRIEDQKIENVIIDLSYNTGGRTSWQTAHLVFNRKWTLDSRNTSIILNILKQVKRRLQKYNASYNSKYLTDLPKGEVNITEKLFEPYFENITNENSPFSRQNYT